MKTYLIQDNVVQALLIYLKKKPFEEVAEGVYALSNLQVYSPTPVVEPPVQP